MKLSAAPLFPLFLLTLLAGGTFWLERATHVEDSVGSGKHRHDPDFIIDNFTTRRFGLDGSLQHTLTAQQMLHYPDDETTEVSAPALTYFAKTPPTRIDARRAWVSKDGKEVRLSEDVRMVRAATPSQPELVVTSAELRVFPDDELARTGTPVTIVDGQSTLHGSGLEANNHTQIFTLLGRVQGTLQRTPLK